MAVASLVLGIAGILFLPFLGQLLAIIFGLIGLSQIKKNNEKGSGLAIAGLVLGIAGLLLWAFLIALGFIAFVGVFSPGQWLPEKCTASSGFTCTQYDKTSTALSFTLENNRGQDVNSVRVQFTPTQGGCAETQQFIGPLANGDSFTVSVPCEPNDSSVRGNFIIYYKTALSSLDREASGVILISR